MVESRNTSNVCIHAALALNGLTDLIIDIVLMC